MKKWLLFLLVFLLFGCTAENAAEVAPAATPAASRATLPDLGAAPELTNTVWLNVEQPLRLANLRGQVVLLEMWTFG